MPSYTTDPHTWDPPDDVDLIVAQERFEESSAFIAALFDWAMSDDDTDDVIAYATNRFITTDAYDKAFEAWVKAGGR